MTTQINRVKILKYALLFPFFVTTLITAGEKPKLHSPKEILELMERSKLTYKIGNFKEDQLPPAEIPQQLSNQLHLYKTETGFAVSEYKLSPEAKQILHNGKEFYATKDYEAALKQYQELYCARRFKREPFLPEWNDTGIMAGIDARPLQKLQDKKGSPSFAQRIHNYIQTSPARSGFA